MIRIATRSSALALAQAGQVAEMLGGAELVEATSDGEPGDKSRFVRGVERALLAGGGEGGGHSAEDPPGEMPQELGIPAGAPPAGPAPRSIRARPPPPAAPPGAPVRAPPPRPPP